MSNGATVVAGATGRLGGLIARALHARGARVRSLARVGTAAGAREALRRWGAVSDVDYRDAAQLSEACRGAACVVSALSGTRDVIVDTQLRLLSAAVAAGVPRFIPSDFAIDFYTMPAGTNRNLDWRREFAEHLDAAPIAATSVLNGMFAELLRGQAPFILFRFHRVVYWENADQAMDFTTMQDVADFTAAVAMDATTPRFLRVAGTVASSRQLAAIAGDATGHSFTLLRAGGLGRLEKLIKFVRLVSPAPNDVYPPWQGMQYMRDMFDGRAKLEPLDNDRYPGSRWTPVRDVLEGANIGYSRIGH